MCQVNDLGTAGLQNAAHDIDSRIMAVEQTGSSEKTQGPSGLCARWFGRGRFSETDDAQSVPPKFE